MHESIGVTCSAIRGSSKKFSTIFPSLRRAERNSRMHSWRCCLPGMALYMTPERNTQSACPLPTGSRRKSAWIRGREDAMKMRAQWQYGFRHNYCRARVFDGHARPGPWTRDPGRLPIRRQVPWKPCIWPPPLLPSCPASICMHLCRILVQALHSFGCNMSESARSVRRKGGEQEVFRTERTGPEIPHNRHLLPDE